MMRALKYAARGMVRRFGYEIVPLAGYRPVVFGSPQVLGSFPPKEHHFSVGPRENHFVHGAYMARRGAVFFDDSCNDRQWQAEVYQFAREIRDREGLTSVCDIGCGSGFKLMRHFSDVTTIGLELPRSCEYLRRRWPGRTWMESELAVAPTFTAELVIAADVIEHLVNPDELLTFLQRLQPRYVVISTPDRNLLRDGGHNGPPRNPAHVREWSFAEFEAYVGSFFAVEDHFISCCAQATQCVLCKPRD